MLRNSKRQDYNSYLNTGHWRKLKRKYITNNPDACCFICGKKYSLVLHHTDYSNLYDETLFNDLYILCFLCHTQTHFYIFKLAKIPLKKPYLLASMYFRKALFKLFNGSVLSALFYLCKSVIVFVWYNLFR